MEGSSISPSSGHAESYVNPSKGIKFLPIAKAKLNYRNPGKWDDYSETLDELTRKSMSEVMTPDVYMRLHYNDHTFGQLTRSVDQRWQDATYLVMNADGEVRPRLDATRRLLHFGIGQTMKEFVATINVNIYNGECGRLDNLKGARFMHHNRMTANGPVIEGFIPFFRVPWEGKDGGPVSQVYAYTSAENKFTILVCSDSQHDDALVHMKTTCSMKKFDKMCAWCGKLRGSGTGDKLKKCPCKICRYCSERCQLEHLPFHRGVCTASGKKEAVQAMEGAK
jgi:hypothetical protein